MKTLKLATTPSRTAQPSILEPVADRRSEPRYRPPAGSAYLWWWEGEEFRGALGRLRDISAGGAALDLEGGPDDPGSVWLCLTNARRMCWIPARVVGREGTVFRMAFAERLPYQLVASVPQDGTDE